MNKNLNNLTKTEREALQMKNDYGLDVALNVAKSNHDKFLMNGELRDHWTRVYYHLVGLRTKLFVAVKVNQ
jgi:hypothetical protein